jgi:hypothetical protein
MIEILIFKYLSSGSRVVSCGQTDRRTHKQNEPTSRSSQICEGIWKSTKNYMCITPIFSIYYDIHNFCYLEYFNIFYIADILQNLGDYADVSQAVTRYITFATDVLLICWFGTQLTQLVRQNRLLLFLLMPLTYNCHNGYRATNHLRNYGLN